MDEKFRNERRLLLCLFKVYPLNVNKKLKFDSFPLPSDEIVRCRNNDRSLMERPWQKNFCDQDKKLVYECVMVVQYTHLSQIGIPGVRSCAIDRWRKT